MLSNTCIAVSAEGFSQFWHQSIFDINVSGSGRAAGVCGVVLRGHNS